MTKARRSGHVEGTIATGKCRSHRANDGESEHRLPENCQLGMSKRTSPCLIYNRFPTFRRNELAEVAVSIVQKEVYSRGRSGAARRRTLGWSTYFAAYHRISSRCLALAVRHNLLRNEGPFFWQLNQDVPPVRNRSEVSSPTLRRPDYLPPTRDSAGHSEYRVAKSCTTEDEALIECSRLLGFASTSQQLREVISRELELLIHTGRLERKMERCT